MTDAYGGYGGIAKFNRDILKALDSSPLIERVFVFPRHVSIEDAERIPSSVIVDRAAAQGKAAFLWRSLTRPLQHLDLVICGHLHLLPFAWLVARKYQARLALIIHGIEAWQPSPHFAANILSRRADVLIAVSGISARRFSSWSAWTGPMRIIPNCVDIEQFTPKPRNPEIVRKYSLDGKKILLTVGRLASSERQKGFDEVIEALPRMLKCFPDLHYIIVGGGGDYERLASKVAQLGISNNVTFCGKVSETEKIALYHIADAYVMPSRGEGFGIVLIEAAASGLPVVGSAVDGSAEALLYGAMGYLINPDSQDELVASVTQILLSSRKGRVPLEIETFSRARFNERVHDWLASECAQTNTRNIH